MNKKLIWSGAVIVIALSAYQINTARPDISAPLECNISSMDAIQNGKTSKIFLTYGDDGAITRLDVDSQHSRTNFTAYLYQKGKIIVYSQADSQKSTTHYTLDTTNKVVFAQDEQVMGAFKYNNEGYLVESVMTFFGSDDKLTFKCSYTDGNLTRITEQSGTNMRYIDIKYSTEPSVDLLGLENPLSYYNYALYDFCDGVLIREGYFGKKSKNLMISGSSSNTSNDFNIALNYVKENGRIKGFKYNSDMKMEYKPHYSCE